MLDTGATTNTMSKSYALHRGFDIIPHADVNPMFQLANGDICTSVGKVTTPALLPSGCQVILTFEVLKHSSHDVVLGAEAIHDYEILWKHAQYVPPSKSTGSSGRFASFTRLNRIQEKIMRFFGKSDFTTQPSAYAKSLALALEQMDGMESQRRKQASSQPSPDGRTEQDKRDEFEEMRAEIWKDLAAVDPGLADKCRPGS